MHTKKVVINLRKWNTMQFDSLKEALEHIPESLLLQYVNQTWHNIQVVKLLDALKERR